MEKLKKLSLFAENWSTLLLVKFRYPALIFLAGVILIGVGVLSLKLPNSSSKIEILPASPTNSESSDIVIEVVGAVENPGVYKLQNGQRIEDALVTAGGLSADANRQWIAKTLNRAAKLTDGQKIYIPKQSEVLSAKESDGDQSVSSNFSDWGSGVVDVNTATLSELDKLPGIGPVYGQNIIDHRPYSNPEELVSKGAIKPSVYEKIKDLVAVY